MDLSRPTEFLRHNMLLVELLGKPPSALITKVRDVMESMVDKIIAGLVRKLELVDERHHQSQNAAELAEGEQKLRKPLRRMIYTVCERLEAFASRNTFRLDGELVKQGYVRSPADEEVDFTANLDDLDREIEQAEAQLESELEAVAQARAVTIRLDRDLAFARELRALIEPLEVLDTDALCNQMDRIAALIAQLKQKPPIARLVDEQYLESVLWARKA